MSTFNDDVTVTKSELRQLMLDFRGEAADVLMSVLDEPTCDFRDDGELTPTHTSNLLTIYRRRARHVREIGLPTVGFDESVARFETTTHDELRIAVAVGPGGFPWAVAFLTPERTEVVAAIAVLAQMPPA